MASREEIAKILGGLALLYPRFKLEKATIAAYCRILADIPGGVLDAAALNLAGTNTFFPAAAELRKAAFKLMEKAQDVPGAWDAWAEVVKSFGPYGHYRGAPEWSHPLIGKAVDAIGGYVALCHSDNPIADRARFVQAYEALLKRSRDDVQMLPEVRQVVQQLAAGKRLERLGSGPGEAGLAGEFFGAAGGGSGGNVDRQ